MPDFNSALPIRTESNGDVSVKIVDGTILSQTLTVDSAGKITVKLDDGSGNSITSQTNGLQRALDVGIDVAGVQVDPRQIRILTSSDVVTASNFPATVDTNSGATGAQTIRTSSNQGTANTIGNGWPVKPTDGTNSQSFTSAGSAKIDIEQLLGSAPSNSNALAVQNVVSGAYVTSTNPMPVYWQDGGISVNDFNTSAALAAAGTSSHDYTVTPAKTLHLEQIYASASGKLKIEVQLETAVGTGIFVSKFVGFNSTAKPNINIPLSAFAQQIAGAKVRIIRTNEDKASMDVYSTICGHEQ